MSLNNYYNNVNRIIVPCGQEADYIQFSRRLNCYLQNKYPRYYAGLQLYSSNLASNIFTVVAYYCDNCGLFQAVPEIQADISRIYEQVWGNDAERISLLDFTENTRVIPSAKKQ